MNRREFVIGVATAWTGPGQGGGPSRIIDTHTHFYDPTRPQGVPWPGKDDPVLSRPVLPSEFSRLTAAYGRVHTVVVEASPWLEDNQWLLDLAKANPVIVGVVGNLQPGGVAFANQVKRFAADPMFRGIRVPGAVILGRIADAGFRDDLRRLADADLELDAHIGADALTAIMRIADGIPNLRIVIDHMPFDRPQRAERRHEYDRLLREIARCRQIYAKISYVLHMGTPKPAPTDLDSHREALEQVWDSFGADRVLYGSNWPVSDLVAPYSIVFGIVRKFFAEKGTDATEKYFWKNALAAYRCVQR
jgi:predicted TIM-barrel fold metal-dependent hydrolase